VLLPYSYKVLLFGRNLPKSGPKSQPEPNVGGNVSTVYDVTTGTYVVTPNYETLFCAGHTVSCRKGCIAHVLVCVSAVCSCCRRCSSWLWSALSATAATQLCS
jgi:hypothetical protein